MKTRLIIENKAARWAFRLHVAPQQPGTYYATLRNNDGAKLDPAPVIGPFLSLDAVVGQADTIYHQLVCMHESGKVARTGASFRETTLNHSAEHLARG